MDNKFLDESKLMIEKDFLSAAELFKKYALNYKRLLDEYSEVHNFLVNYSINASANYENWTPDLRNDFIKTAGALIARLLNYHHHINVLKNFSNHMDPVIEDINEKHIKILEQVEVLGLEFYKDEIKKK
jgi:hypothetical protein